MNKLLKLSFVSVYYELHILLAKQEVRKKRKKKAKGSANNDPTGGGRKQG